MVSGGSSGKKCTPAAIASSLGSMLQELAPALAELEPTFLVLLGDRLEMLAAATAALADLVITIPLAGPTESLNVAAAGAVLCFESLRQRRARPRRAPGERELTGNPSSHPSGCAS